MVKPSVRRAVESVGTLLLALALAGCGSPLHQESPTPQRPESIILLIGDGLGFSQLAFARIFLQGKEGRLVLESLPVTALVSTYSTSNPVTDSAASATAMATGVKTDNRSVGMDPGGRDLRTFAELAQEKGWELGYVTTTRITHATPAAYYGATADRHDEESLALQLLAQRPAVVLGGGLRSFLPASRGGRRGDGRELLAEARQAGYTLWEPGSPAPRPLPRRLLGLLAPSHLPYVLDEAPLPPDRRTPSLEELTRLALELLAAKGSPFFLLVEGGRIDHAGHDFDAVTLAFEVEAFDRAVAAAMEFQAEHPGVLLLVTADHATGGLALNDYVDWEALRRQRASLASMVERIREGGGGPELLGELTGFQDFTAADVDKLRQAEDEWAAARLLGTMLGERQGVTWLPRINLQETKGHTGEDVPLYARGPGAQEFQGVLDNADLPRILIRLLGWEELN